MIVDGRVFLKKKGSYNNVIRTDTLDGEKKIWTKKEKEERSEKENG